MRSWFRLVIAVCSFSAILIIAVYLRSANNRFFYKLRTYYAEQTQLKQQLNQQQLCLEGMITPVVVSEHFDE
jgi:hypothetical protein